MTKDFKSMTDKQFSFIKRLECACGAKEEDSKLLKALNEKREKVSTRLASKVIDHLLAFENFMRQSSRHYGVTIQDVYALDDFDEDENNLIAQIKNL